MKRVKIEINGMTCHNCEKHVEKELKRFGAKKIKVSYVEGNAVFSVSSVNPDVLKEKIKAIGYSPGNIFVKEDKGFLGRILG